MLDRIDHIGIAVAELEPALELWGGGFQLEVSHREVMPEQGVEAVLLDLGENHVELLAPLGPDTPVGKFLAKRGPGLHHVAYQVSDIDAALQELAREGHELIDKSPRVGIGGARVAFLEPKSTGRVLVEIVEPVHGVAHAVDSTAEEVAHSRVHSKISDGPRKPLRGDLRHPRCSPCHQHGCARGRRISSTDRLPRSRHLFWSEP